MIEVKNISKSYGQLKAVENISLTIGQGESFVLLGPSGCGKTTILRLIAGFEEPDSGEISLQGKTSSIDQRVIIPPNKRGVGMVFQDLALWPHMTVEKNIGFALDNKKMTKSDRKERVKELLDSVNLGQDYLHSYPSQLSGGEQQRVALARAIAPEPNILLLDEPLSSLDPQLKDDLLRLIIDIQKKSKMTTLYVTHDQEEAFAAANIIAVMSKGVIEQIGTSEEIINNPSTDFVETFIKVKN